MVWGFRDYRSVYTTGLPQRHGKTKKKCRIPTDLHLEGKRIINQYTGIQTDLSFQTYELTPALIGQ
jgi:hypothetical protein